MSTPQAHRASVPPEPATESAPRPLHVPFGDPAGLGLAGFGMTTFVLSVVNAGTFTVRPLRSNVVVAVVCCVEPVPQFVGPGIQ